MQRRRREGSERPGPLRVDDVVVLVAAGQAASRAPARAPWSARVRSAADRRRPAVGPVTDRRGGCGPERLRRPLGDPLKLADHPGRTGRQALGGLQRPHIQLAEQDEPVDEPEIGRLARRERTVVEQEFHRARRRARRGRAGCPVRPACRALSGKPIAYVPSAATPTWQASPNTRPRTREMPGIAATKNFGRPVHPAERRVQVGASSRPCSAVVRIVRSTGRSRVNACPSTTQAAG